MKSDSPIVDLSSLPIDLQAEEYHFRLERGKVHPNAVTVVFIIDKIAKAVVDSGWWYGKSTDQFFLSLLS
jgi:hypothetical protein